MRDFFSRRVVNVKPRTSQVNPSPALVSWRGALPPGNAACGELKHDLFFVELGRVLGLTTVKCQLDDLSLCVKRR